MLSIVHYLSILHRGIDSPQTLERFRVCVPTNISYDASGLVAPRRRQRLLELPAARTVSGRHAPTNRALRTIGDILAQHYEIDLFADGLGKLFGHFLKSAVSEAQLWAGAGGACRAAPESHSFKMAALHFRRLSANDARLR
ncbi:hypothetical protein ACJJTC_003956 [Scirpophaga incertulas]